MRRRTHLRLAAALLLLLVGTHLDFWRPQREVLWFGWLPEELAWRLLWMAGAAAFLVFLTRTLWSPGDVGESEGPAEEEER